MVRGEERIRLDATTKDVADAEATRRSADLPGVWILFCDGQDVSWSRLDGDQWVAVR
jgi:hypothetical protein